MSRILDFMTYAEYLETEQWKRRRRLALRRAGDRCQVCGARAGYELEVHHNDYSNLGEERDIDLVVLCKDCHEVYEFDIKHRPKR